MGKRRYAILIIVTFGLLGALYSFVTPLWEAPDEPSHFLYVKHVAEHGRPPHNPVTQRGHFWQHGYLTKLYEWHHPALYYAVGGGVIRVGRAIAPGILPEEFPPVNPLMPRPLSPHLFLPANLDPFAPPRDHVGPLLLRLMSVGMAMGTLWVSYRLARLAKPERPAFAFAVLGLMAFVPQFTYLSATINNDNLANLLSSLTILLLMRLLLASDAEPLERQMLTLGLLLGVGLLTKLTLTFLLPLVTGAWLFVALGRRELRAAVRYAWLILVPILLLVGAYHGVFPEARAAWVHNTQSLRTNPDYVSWAYLQRVLEQLPITFWGKFGWGRLPLPRSLIVALGALTFGGVIITLGTTLIGWNRRRWSRERRVVLFLLSAVALNFLGFIRFNLTVFQPQGRFLFPTLAPLFILALMGVWRLVPDNWESSIVALLVGGMLLVDVYALAGVLYPGYYRQPLVSAYQGAASKAVGEIAGKKRHGQSFVARYDGLSRIDLMLATYARENHHPVRFHLKRTPDDPHDLFTEVLDASTVADNAYYTFAFDPIPDSGGQEFYFYLESPRSVPGDAITVWAEPKDVYPSGARYEDHEPVNGDLRFIAVSTP